MSRIVLSIGFISSDWSQASDGSKKIMVGDTDHSRTVEYEYEIGDDGFKNLTTGKLLTGSMDVLYKQIANDTETLSGGLDYIPTPVVRNIYELCLEETGDVDSFIDLFEEGISEFQNSRKKYNGCFYCRYIVEDEDAGEIEKELLFVVKRK